MRTEFALAKRLSKCITWVVIRMDFPKIQCAECPVDLKEGENGFESGQSFHPC